MVQMEWDGIAVGSTLKMEQNHKSLLSGPRAVRFSADQRAEALWAKLREPTYTSFSGINTSLVSRTFGAQTIRDLAPDERQYLKDLWAGTLRAILLSDAFEANPVLLEQAIQAGDLCVYYVLVGRYNAAETGHVDGVKVFVTDSQKVVIAKLRKSKVLLYPYGFIDTVAVTHKYLF